MTELHVNDAIVRFAAAQANSFSRSQALALGATSPMIDRRLRNGQWRRELPGTYTLAGTAPTWTRGLWLAVLAVGHEAVVSHQAAAARHHLLGFPEGCRVVTVPHSGFARLPGITVHQISDLTSLWCTDIDGLPITTVARTFVDLAAVTRRIRLRMALDDARSAGRVTLEQVATALGAVARRGKPGVRLLGAVLDDLGPGTMPAVTVLEARLHHVVEQAGLPPLAQQHPLPGRGAVTGCVDGAWLDAKLIVEADSRRWHTRVQDLCRDHLRDQEASRVGWQVLRVMHEHLVSDPAGVGEMLRDTRSIRLRQVA